MIVVGTLDPIILPMDWEKWEKPKTAATGLQHHANQKKQKSTQMRVIGKPDFDQ